MISCLYIIYRREMSLSPNLELLNPLLNVSFVSMRFKAM